MDESAVHPTPTYVVTAQRKKKGWLLEATVDGVAITTKVRRLHQAAALARKAIAQSLGLSERSFGIELTVTVPDDLQVQLDRTREAFQQAATARAHAALLGHRTAKSLKQRGLGKRDIGAMMGISHGRVTKLLGQYRSGREA